MTAADRLDEYFEIEYAELVRLSPIPMDSNLLLS
jgi:hypothetical protein